MARIPLRNGWRVLMRAPASVLAEIAWRWTFGVALSAILYYSFREYFATVEISPTEYHLLRSLQPMTWMAVTVRLMVALVTGLRVVGPIVIPALVILWIALATIGRAATVRALCEAEPRTNWLSSVGLQTFRVALSFAAFFAFFGSGILIDAVVGDPAQHFGAVFLLATLALIVIALLWTVINWFVSLAAVFTVRDQAGLFGSIRDAVELYRRERDPFVSSGFGFGVIRTVLFVAVTIASLMIVVRFNPARPLATIVPVLVISLPYFAIADAVIIWRLAAYISFSEPEPEPPVVATPPPTPESLSPIETGISSEPEVPSAPTFEQAPVEPPSES